MGGVTPEQQAADDEMLLPEYDFSGGQLARPTRNEDELSVKEIEVGIPSLMECNIR